MQCLFLFASVLPRKSKFLLQNEALLRSFNPEAYEKAMNSAETGPAFRNRAMGSARGCTLEMSDEELVCFVCISASVHLGSWCKLQRCLESCNCCCLFGLFLVFGPLVNTYIGSQWITGNDGPRVEMGGL